MGSSVQAAPHQHPVCGRGFDPSRQLHRPLAPIHSTAEALPPTINQIVSSHRLDQLPKSVHLVVVTDAGELGAVEDVYQAGVCTDGAGGRQGGQGAVHAHPGQTELVSEALLPAGEIDQRSEGVIGLGEPVGDLRRGSGRGATDPRPPLGAHLARQVAQYVLT